MARRAAREAGFFGLFLLLAALLTWPLPIRLSTAVADTGDPLLNAWILDWVSHALVHQPFRLFDAPIYYPALKPLAYSENLLGIALLTLPLHLAGIPPLTLYNIALLLGFAHAGYGAFVLARFVTRSEFASVLAGVFFAFLSFKFDHLSHLQMIWSGWLPLLLAALLAYVQRPDNRRAALVFAAFVMNGLTNIHFLLFGSAATGLLLLFAPLVLPRFGWKQWLRIVVTLALACLVILPVLLPYKEVSAHYKMVRIVDEVASGSATWTDWLRVTGRSRYRPLMDPEVDRPERQLFPGLMPLFLLVTALVMTPRSAGDGAPPEGGQPNRRTLLILDVLIVIFATAAWIGIAAGNYAEQRLGDSVIAQDPLMLLIVTVAIRLTIRFPRALGGDEGRSLRTAMDSSRFSFAAWAGMLWIVIGVLGSLGFHAFFHPFLYGRLEPFQSIRAPARWAIITYTGLTIWFALGVVTLLAQRKSRHRNVVAAVLAVCTVIDVVPVIQWQYFEADPPPVYRWLSRNRVGPLLELPFGDTYAGPFKYVLFSAAHRVPLMNGTSGFEPPLSRELRLAFDRSVDDSFFELLERNGARTVIVHADHLGAKSDEVRRWIQRQMALGRMRFIRRFDSTAGGGDWLFALHRNFPDWERFSEPRRDEALARFLAGEPTYNGSTFGRVEVVARSDRAGAPLMVGGWALSPHGVRRATLLVDDQTLRVPMERVEHPEISAKYPWYPKNSPAGFRAVLLRRPRGVPAETDVQVEIEDGRGVVTRLPNLVFTWK